ncbi:hypothetical protein B0T17DRAFT_530465 [Bombardia bombarda]|uniref:Uncharacterized protein n=1 Tax=Bombardia bombarda TaxID=252184 RepID=A0AA39X063_9PEZI|nr:hypothetical protein B0T17DRAFT_530465 [Bombardia bombarda]
MVHTGIMSLSPASLTISFILFFSHCCFLSDLMCQLWWVGQETPPTPYPCGAIAIGIWEAKFVGRYEVTCADVIAFECRSLKRSRQFLFPSFSSL